MGGNQTVGYSVQIGRALVSAPNNSGYIPSALLPVHYLDRESKERTRLPRFSNHILLVKSQASNTKTKTPIFFKKSKYSKFFLKCSNSRLRNLPGKKDKLCTENWARSGNLNLGYDDESLGSNRVPYPTSADLCFLVCHLKQEMPICPSGDQILHLRE